MTTLAQFQQIRKPHTNQLFPSPGSTKTILITSHIWWCDMIALAFWRAGFNVLLAEPWYLLYTDDQRFANFDALWNSWLAQIKQHNVQAILGGNSSAIIVHPRTGELLHNAAGVPVIHYWWDEFRTRPPMTKRGITLDQYLNSLRDEHTLNAVWDLDVCQEMRQFFAINQAVHVPLATEPQIWPNHTTSLAQRPHIACFLGNCFRQSDEWEAGLSPELKQRVRAVAELKAQDLDIPMTRCVESVIAEDSHARAAFTASEGAQTDLNDVFDHWCVLEAVLRKKLRYERIGALASHLGEQLILCGQGWEKLGLKAAKSHSGVPDAGSYYGNCKAALNLFGGCVHSGMPLRPFEICCSGGLLFTQYNRELPDMFEIGRECVAFRTNEEMLTQMDRIVKSPAEFDAVVAAGRNRTLKDHTWDKRVQTILSTAQERLDLPW
jgi:hypothetical protein